MLSKHLQVEAAGSLQDPAVDEAEFSLYQVAYWAVPKLLNKF